MALVVATTSILDHPPLSVRGQDYARTSGKPPNRNAKYGPYLQIRKYLGLYFAVFTVKKAKYMPPPPNSHLAAPKCVFDVPATKGSSSSRGTGSEKFTEGQAIWMAPATGHRGRAAPSPPCSFHPLIKCPGTFQNALGAFRNAITYATLRRAPRGRPDLAGCLPRCVRTDTGRVEVCGKPVPTTLVVEPRTFEQCVLKEEHSNQTSGHGAGI